MQQVAELHELFPEPLGRVMSVMQMDFHFPESVPAEVRQPVQDLGVILLLGIEEGMARGTTVGIVESGNGLRICIDPFLHDASGLFRSRSTPERLEMVADRDNQVACAPRPSRPAENRGEIAE